ncbi:hypothetical protein LINPERHAP1_LOCUS26419, partial [Linum perenne]
PSFYHPRVILSIADRDFYHSALFSSSPHSTFHHRRSSVVSSIIPSVVSSIIAGLSSLPSSPVGPPSFLADPPSSHQAPSSISPISDLVANKLPFPGIGGYLVDLASGSFSNALVIVEILRGAICLLSSGLR